MPYDAWFISNGCGLDGCNEKKFPTKVGAWSYVSDARCRLRYARHLMDHQNHGLVKNKALKLAFDYEKTLVGMDTEVFAVRERYRRTAAIEEASAKRIAAHAAAKTMAASSSRTHTPPRKVTLKKRASSVAPQVVSETSAPSGYNNRRDSSNAPNRRRKDEKEEERRKDERRKDKEKKERRTNPKEEPTDIEEVQSQRYVRNSLVDKGTLGFLRFIECKRKITIEMYALRFPTAHNKGLGFLYKFLVSRLPL